MPKEIIDRIKHTEAEAYELRRKAEQDARDSVAKAAKEAEKLCEDARIRAESENKTALEAARLAASQRIDAMRIASYENAANLTSVADARLEKALQLIVSAVLGEV